jgi:hypothetical protein
MKEVLLVTLMAIGLSGFGFVGKASAELEAGEFLNQYDEFTLQQNEFTLQQNKQLAGDLETYITGIAHGIQWASTKWNIKAFCLPSKLSITTSQIISMLRQYIIKYPDWKQFPVASVLLYAYEYTFPCNTQEAK